MPKKMHPDGQPARKKEQNESAEIKINPRAKILGYTPPVYCNNKCGSYIQYYAYDPRIGNMHRVRMKINRIKNSRRRKEYALEKIKTLNKELISGWNPYYSIYWRYML